jgi:hypothetical protein
VISCSASRKVNSSDALQRKLLSSVKAIIMYGEPHTHAPGTPVLLFWQQ